MNEDPLSDALRRALAGERAALARVITFLESQRDEDSTPQLKLLEQLLNPARKTLRVGITGLPGAGKSTLIDELGTQFIAAGHRVAVLAIDPSSSVSGGSILGDKTRMERLAAHPHAFVRPTPTGGFLGGTSTSSREACIAVEAAGYDVVLIETVGVGQSEAAVRDLVDVVVLVTLTGGGDELQGMKRGLIELADIVVVNKADGENLTRAENLKTELIVSIRALTSYLPGWSVPVLALSALSAPGVTKLREAIEACAECARSSSFQGASLFENLRCHQDVKWCEARILRAVRSWAFRGRARTAYEQACDLVRKGQISIPQAVERVLAVLRG
jgi:LAO/AO transport system kinase